MRVLVDYREPSHLIESIESLLRTVEVVELETGDIAIVKEEAILIERKTVRDFFSSIWNNRLWGQLERLAEIQEIWGTEVRRRLLLIHGEFDFYDNLGSAIGAMLESTFVYGVPVIRLCSDDELFAFLRVEVNREIEGKNSPMFLPDYRKLRKREEDPRAYVLTSIPLIGPMIAKNLLERFGSVAGVVNSSLDDLERVEGVGKKRANEIFKVLHDPFG